MKAKTPTRCLNCGKMGHHHAVCKAPKVIRCFICKAANVKTKHCPCQIPAGQDLSRIQALRRVGLKIYRSVMIEGEIYEAVFSTLAEITRISFGVYGTLKLFGYETSRQRTINIPIKIGERTYRHSCVIDPRAENEVVIGMDLLNKIGFSFTVGDQVVNNESPVFMEPYEIRTINFNHELHKERENAMNRAVLQHNTERLRDLMEWEAMPTGDDLEDAMRACIITDDE